MSMRIGYGFDSHAFKAGVALIIGGLKIAHHEGLAGHSDGDVLLHAVTDALLGAVSAGDIGSFFPPSDPRWKDADSAIFLKTALEEIAIAGYKIVNIDTVLILAAPKISPIAGDLRQSVADLLGLRPMEVGIKAKTPEGMNLDHMAMAHATVLLESIDLHVGPERMTASVDIDRDMDAEVDGVVESLVGGRRDISALGRKVPGFDPDDLT